MTAKLPSLTNCMYCNLPLKWVTDSFASEYAFVCFCDCNILYLVDRVYDEDNNYMSYIDCNAYRNQIKFGAHGNLSGSGDQSFLQRMTNRKLIAREEGKEND